MKNGALVHKLMVRYTNFKEVTKMVALPDKPSVVALIDVDKVGDTSSCQSRGADHRLSRVFI